MTSWCFNEIKLDVCLFVSTIVHSEYITLVHYSMGFCWWFSLWKIFSKMQTNGNLGTSLIYSES